MTFAAVMTTLNEADIAERTIRHLLAEGAGIVLVAAGPSTDGTREILQRLHDETGRVAVHLDSEFVHRQQTWIDGLARIAHDSYGYPWILPVDADEFWYCPDGRTLKEVFDAVPDDVRVLQATLYHHLDENRKVVPAEGLPKVAYRWEPNVHIGPGSHTVNIGPALAGLLEVRHWQYRSFEHFCQKVRDRNATLAPEGRARGDGWHHTRLEGASEDDLRNAWAELEARANVEDPIPFRS